MNPGEVLTTSVLWYICGQNYGEVMLLQGRQRYTFMSAFSRFANAYMDSQ